MLIRCILKDFALIQEAELDFQSGMSVLTGETGAGKSLLLSAIRLCFQDKIEPLWIREGAEQAEISCTFQLEKPYTIHRILSHRRSKTTINNKKASKQELKDLSLACLQIHSQNQQPLLLKASEQLRLVDLFADHAELISEVQNYYNEHQKLSKEQQTIKDFLEKNNSRLDLLQYQLNEIDQLNLQAGELEKLDQQQNQLHHAKSDFETLVNIRNLLEKNTLPATLESLKKILPRHPSLENAYETIQSLAIQNREILDDIKQYAQLIHTNTHDLKNIEQRLSEIFEMARKHKVRPEALIEHFALLKQDLNNLNEADEKLEILEKSIRTTQENYTKFAEKLTLSRQSASTELAKRIEHWLEPLGIIGARFGITLKPKETPIAPYGLENIEFCVSTNADHKLQALSKIASGGELSRISLAIQLVLADYLNTPTLIFDEIDVGVGGKIGAIIGQALHQLGHSVQVLCISHLAQVAGFADHHIHAVKHRLPHETITTLNSLDKTQRLEELARMLGGLQDNSQQALEHAKTLLMDHEDTLRS